MCAKQETKLKREGPIPVFVISGPSGCGKTSVSDLVVGELGIKRSISATTRSQRPDEIDGKDYRFVSHEEFVEGVRRGDYLEHAEYLGNLYGTPRRPIEQAIESDEPTLLDIDVQGATQVKRLYPGAVLVFLMPPSEEVLFERLSKRGTDVAEEIKKRVERAREEISQKDNYQYVVVNEELRDTVDQIKGIILQEIGK
jgi:guanylate kinase